MRISGFYLAFFLLLSSVIYGETPMFVYDGQYHEINGRNIDILEDPSGELTIKQVIKSSKFTPNDLDIPNLMISKSVFWAKIQISNISNDEHLLCIFYLKVNCT